MKAALTLTALAAGALLAASAAPVPAAAQQERIRRLVVYGKDPCPRATSGEEIIVCARRPNTERYRIPRELRDQATDGADGASWAARAQSLEYAGRSGTQSCSATGPGGSTGCLEQLIRTWRGERARTGTEPGR